VTSQGAKRIAGNALLVALFLLFAYANFRSWRDTGRPVGFGITILSATVAFLFIVRRPPEQTSRRAIAWLAAPVGTFAMLLARPVAEPHAGPALALELVQLCGVVVAFAGLGMLGRSFGLVAANRGVKTSGLYRLVRHPVYAGYFLSDCGYVLENPSLRNVALLAATIIGQLVRIGEEERLLTADRTYRDYCSRVRYRLIPYLY
jgi:protein-S-isoprenylcysteine O-methyltransferase Ste14